MFVSPVWKIHILVKISCLSLEKMYICDMLKKTFLTSIGGFLEDPRAWTTSGIAELSNFQHVPHFIEELSTNCSQTFITKISQDSWVKCKLLAVILWYMNIYSTKIYEMENWYQYWNWIFKRILLFSYEFSKNDYRIIKKKFQKRFKKRFEVRKFFVGTD